ncbi:MAG TPA: hypothetical protein VFI25_13900 [Planctomycetota bacterium]|jgi:hypothetical protein|nr:hypothetical protein [Planctomycetota bacterium]
MPNRLRALAVLFVPAVLASAIHAQATCGAFSVSISPNPAPFGQPVTVTLTNTSGSTALLVAGCAFQSVSQGASSVFNPLCLPFAMPVPPAGQVSQTWDQKANCGQQVDPGLYSVEVYPLGGSLCSFPLTISPCPVGATSTFGTGCGPGAPFTYCNGTPKLTIDGCPQIGSTFNLRLSNGEIAFPGAIALGVSNTSWLGVPLPIGIGGCCGGCSILIAPEIFLVGTTNAIGLLSVPITIPNNPSFVGATVYAQGGTAAVSSNVFLSHGLAVTIG